MKVLIIYHGEPDAGINASSFELDLGDMFDVDLLVSEGDLYREAVRKAISDLSALSNGTPDSVTFEDELIKENALWDKIAEMHEEQERDDCC